jgi:HEAT repeat protein
MTSQEDKHRSTFDVQKSTAELLSEALHADDDEERMRAARLLRDAPDEDTIPALLTALGDSNPGVRWLAAEALIRIGKPAVVPLLGLLVREHPSIWLAEEAEHILRHLQLPEFQGALAPVIAACEHSTRDVELPVQAEIALLAISHAVESPSRGDP